MLRQHDLKTDHCFFRARYWSWHALLLTCAESIHETTQETHHEAIVRVALELALEPEVMMLGICFHEIWGIGTGTKGQTNEIRIFGEKELLYVVGLLLLHFRCIIRLLETPWNEKIRQNWTPKIQRCAIVLENISSTKLSFVVRWNLWNLKYNFPFSFGKVRRILYWENWYHESHRRPTLRDSGSWITSTCLFQFVSAWKKQQSAAKFSSWRM